MTKLIHIKDCYHHIELLKKYNLINQNEFIDLLCISVLHNKGKSMMVGVDRTKPTKINYIDIPIPNYSKLDTIENIILNRAEKIWNIGKPIKIFWSGGIDSTAALIALIRTNTEWYKSLQVITTKNEYPFFASNFLESKNVLFDLSNDKVKIVDSTFYDNSAIYITGDHGDQVFGPALLKVPGGPSMRLIPLSSVYSGFLEYIWSKTKLLTNNFENINHSMMNNDSQIFKDWVYNFSNRCPVPLNTTYDFLWWCNFVFTWHEKRTFKFVGKTGDPNIVNKLMSFFDDESFQIWSIYYNQNRLKDLNDWKTHKKDLKDFIFKFTEDENYYNNYGKVPSRIAHDMNHKIVYADSDGLTVDSYDKLSKEILSKTVK